MSPPRRAVRDHFDGSLVLLDGVALLTTLDNPPGTSATAGPLELRYGLVCLDDPRRCIVPELVVLEYGEQMTGEAALDFLLNHSNLHPRAEVLGQRDDGVEDQLRVSRLDLAQPPRVLVWPGDAPAEVRPLAAATALVNSGPESSPARLRQFLPCYPSFADWRDARS